MRRVLKLAALPQTSKTDSEMIKKDVTSTVTAAPYVWALLQAFYTQFPQYESRQFGIFTESYGGHYGPEFASYFESQNAAIKAGSVKGDNIDLIALGINNGWYDAAIQEQSYVDYSVRSESICPLSDRFLSLETCTRSLYSEKNVSRLNKHPPSFSNRQY